MIKLCKNKHDQSSLRTVVVLMFLKFLSGFLIALFSGLNPVTVKVIPLQITVTQFLGYIAMSFNLFLETKKSIFFVTIVSSTICVLYLQM